MPKRFRECFDWSSDDSDTDSWPDLEPPSPKTWACPEGCDSFCADTAKRQVNKIPAWNDWAISECGVHRMYEPFLESQPEWLALPDREWCLEHGKDNPHWYALLNPLTFDKSTGLGECRTWLFRFLVHGHTRAWYHLALQAECMESYVEAMQQVDVAVLPYRCVTYDGIPFDDEVLGQKDIRTHQCRFIVVAKDDSEYQKALKKVRFPTKRGYRRYYHKKILDMKHFVSVIQFLSDPTSILAGNFWNPKAYFRSHVMLSHGVWWMCCLVPGGVLDRLAAYRVDAIGREELQKGRRMGERGKEVCASRQLGVENCVMRFDPPGLVIGDPVRDVHEHVRSGLPFVYGFRGEMLSINSLKYYDPKEFVDTCIMMKTNTLLNLKGKDWVVYTRNKKKEYEYN